MHRYPLLEHQKVWSHPRFPFEIRGFSRARRATGFEFAGILLDMGLRTDMQPQAAVITHTHTDHCGEVSHCCVHRKRPFPIFCPIEAVGPLIRYMDAFSGLSGNRDRVIGRPTPLEPDQGWVRVSNEKGAAGKMVVRAIPLAHSVPCQGYVFGEKRTKLRSELRGMSGAEIAARKRGGTVVNDVIIVPMLAFLCDGSSDSLLRALESLSHNMPIVVLLECTYVDSAHRGEAVKRGHGCWADMEDTLTLYPDTIFLLFHFSERYTRRELRTFSATLPTNVVAFFE